MAYRASKARKRNTPEEDHQAALFDWVDLHVGKYPELGALYHVPNGGLRNVNVGKRLQKLGLRAGVWDLSLDVARDGYHGLKIEMKSLTGRLTTAQREWRERYVRHGYRCIICRSWEMCRGLILEYLGYE